MQLELPYLKYECFLPFPDNAALNFVAMGIAIMNTENLVAVNNRASPLQRGVSVLAAFSSSFLFPPCISSLSPPCSAFKGIIFWSLEVAEELTPVLLVCAVCMRSLGFSSCAGGKGCSALRCQWPWQSFFSLPRLTVCDPGQQEPVHCHPLFITAISRSLWSLKLAFSGGSDLRWSAWEGKFLLLPCLSATGEWARVAARVVHHRLCLRDKRCVWAGQRCSRAPQQPQAMLPLVSVL